MGAMRLHLFLLAGALYGQMPEFEVVSIRPAPRLTPALLRSGQYHQRMDNGGFEDSNATLETLICLAYSIDQERVSGPGWISEQTFAVAAKLPAGANKNQIPAMLQGMLADRFKLAVHHDQREQRVYLLRVGKDGVKLKPSSGDEPQCGGRPGRYMCRATPVAQLAANLTRMAAMYARMPLPENGARNIDLPVVDETELAGAYDIDLQWIPPAGTGDGRGRGGPLSPPDASVQATSIFGAFEALGLKLVPAKHSFDYLVIDHVERTPTEN